jgi:hypothetical protein
VTNSAIPAISSSLLFVINSAIPAISSSLLFVINSAIPALSSSARGLQHVEQRVIQFTIATCPKFYVLLCSPYDPGGTRGLEHS